MFYLENEVQLQTVDKEGVGRISEDSNGGGRGDLGILRRERRFS